MIKIIESKNCSYQKGLEEDLLFDDIVTEDVNEDEKIPFVPAFDELMKYIKKYIQQHD